MYLDIAVKPQYDWKSECLSGDLDCEKESTTFDFI